MANCGKSQVRLRYQIVKEKETKKDPNIRFELTDPTAMNIVRLITESIQVEKLRFLFALPLLRYIMPEQSGWNKQKEVKQKLSKMTL